MDALALANISLNVGTVITILLHRYGCCVIVGTDSRPPTHHSDTWSNTTSGVNIPGGR